MTESEWDACADPTPMLTFLSSRASDRKLRLFALGCCRNIWPQITDKRSRQAVLIGEKSIEGLATKDELEAAWESVFDTDQSQADWVVLDATGRRPLRSGTFRDSMPWEAAMSVVRRISRTSVLGKGDLPGILRDIIGNPFQPLRLDAEWLAWNDGVVHKLAQAIYADRAFDRLPLLADALEDAGCDNADILSHCRQPGEHVRGCWVVDLLLGKE